MSYPRITALVPQGEYFDSTALNEGIWVTTGHFNAIENALETVNGSVTTLTTERDNLQQQLTQAQQDAQTAATQAQNDLQARDNTIASLQNQIATLKKSPAGEFQTTARDEDPQPGNSSTPSYADENNPLNRLADSMFGKPVSK
ncbi:hypothetical protein FAM09_24800 [Niastella caeni]|uniref:Uncharacterized protein n=1 Tax=Niastella caeni TaxID=2569763 RepID=A0A4S8HI84_9BACT|nr:hypothetical protein [Niastella caeni]THU34241.1 hypothetical protein FAM09_24800 [Niastella caeni]